MTGTLIISEVDFNAEGRQAGFLRVPHSTHRSAYGWIPLPITVIRNGDRPTLILTAGVHGDEYEGQIAVAELARMLDTAEIRGRVILLPMVFFLAAEARCRVSPVDDGNLNRLYPGNFQGTLSEMIAHFHEEVIVPLADYAVDLHSGGSSLIYPPTLLRGPAHSPHPACIGNVTVLHTRRARGDTSAERARVDLCRRVRSVRAAKDPRRGCHKGRNRGDSPSSRYAGESAGCRYLTLRRSCAGHAGAGAGSAWRRALPDCGGCSLT
jgi:predicted deacylase